MGTVTVEVRRAECPCPGAFHVVETVELQEALDMPLAAGALAAVNEAPVEEAAVQAALIKAYLPAAIRRWSFMEPDGTGGIRGVPITRENMDRLLPWSKGGFEVAQKADSLYSEELLRPLAGRTSIQSQDGPTAPSTSAIQPSGTEPPEQSVPYSPTILEDGLPYVDRAS